MIPDASTPGPAPFQPTRSTWLILGILFAALVAYCVHLWPEWRHNPDLSHGFFAPFIFLLLIRESRAQGPWRWLPAKSWSAVALAILLGTGVVILALAGLFAATLAWSHAVVLFLLAAAQVCLLGGGLLLLAGNEVRLVPLNWISFTAIVLWLLVAPIPDGTYSRLTLGLQTRVTTNVMGILHLIGVPARQHGNVIELARTTVGVEEACSGVRSLISCVYAGFFFAAWHVRRPFRRLVVILIAPAMALGMNLVRSLTLTLLANAGVDISGTWHDATGFAILGLTAAGLAGLALLLESKPAGIVRPTCTALPKAMPRSSLLIFCSGIALASGLGIFFFVHTRDRREPSGPAPDLASLVPNQALGWRVSQPADLYRFSSILQTTHLMERTYTRTEQTGPPTQITVYVAYWPAGQTSVSRVASHTPDACWPGSGWNRQISADDSRQSLRLPGINPAPAEYRLFRTENGFSQHVWFWHVFDGRVIDYRDPYSIPALLQIALQYGFRRQGSQYFVRLSSNRPWSELAGEPLSREILAGLAKTGL